MRKTTQLWLGVALIGLLIGLVAAMAMYGGAGSTASFDVAGVRQALAPMRAAESRQYESAHDASGADAERSAASPPVAGRLIIYTSRLTLRVADPRDEMAALQQLVRAHAGYVQSSALQQDDRGGHHTARLHLRVPADRMDDLLAAVHSREVQVLDEQRDASDVTEQHADLHARLRNAERTEQELLALMTELREKTGNLEAVLATHRELSNVREQIERMQASQRQLQDRVAMASVELHLLGPSVPAVQGHPQWSAWGTVTAASATLVRMLQVVLSVVIYSVIIGLPLALLLVLSLAAALKLRSRLSAT